jgi:hypothetical protein
VAVISNREIEILDFDKFKELYPRLHHINECRELFALGLYQPPPYMRIYECLASVCEEQRKVLNQSLDQTTLSATIPRFPKLKAVNLTFKSATVQWLRPLIYRGLILDYESSFYHHLHVVVSAMNATKDHIKFKGLQLSRDFLERYPNFSHISRSIPHIIQPLDAIRYERAGMILQALAKGSPQTSQSDDWICHAAFGIFLSYHTGSSIPIAQNAVFHSMLQNTVQCDSDSTFNIWEPGWALQVRGH